MVCSILARAGWSFSGTGTSCCDETVGPHAPAERDDVLVYRPRDEGRDDRTQDATYLLRLLSASSLQHLAIACILINARGMGACCRTPNRELGTAWPARHRARPERPSRTDGAPLRSAPCRSPRRDRAGQERQWCRPRSSAAPSSTAARPARSSACRWR